MELKPAEGFEGFHDEDIDQLLAAADSSGDGELQVQETAHRCRVVFPRQKGDIRLTTVEGLGRSANFIYIVVSFRAVLIHYVSIPTF